MRSRALAAGDVFAVQLRLKPLTTAPEARAIEALLPVCRSRGTALLLNAPRRPRCGHGLRRRARRPDGHAARAARRVMVPTSRSVSRSRRSISLGAPSRTAPDGRAFGAFFPSTSKPVTALADPGSPAPLVRAERLALLRDRRIACGQPARSCGLARICSRSSAACGAIPTAPPPAFARSTPRSSLQRRRKPAHRPRSDHPRPWRLAARAALSSSAGRRLWSSPGLVREQEPGLDLGACTAPHGGARGMSKIEIALPHVGLGVVALSLAIPASVPRLHAPRETASGVGRRVLRVHPRNASPATFCSVPPQHGTRAIRALCHPALPARKGPILARNLGCSTWHRPCDEHGYAPVQSCGSRP
jgi:hypothetical protein